MMFFFYIALAFMKVINSVSKNLEQKNQEQSGVQSAGVLAAVITGIIPPLIIWIGMGVAMKMGIYGAEATMGRAKKFSKSFGKGIVGTPGWISKQFGVTGGVKQRWNQFKERSMFGEQAVKAREARMAERLGVTGATESNMKTQAEEYKKRQYSKEQLQKMAQGGDLAATYRLAEDGNIDEASYEKAMEKTKKNEKLRTVLENKTRAKRADVIIKHNLKNRLKEEEERKGSPLSAGDIDLATQDETQKEMKKLKAADWENQNMEELTRDPAMKAGVGHAYNTGYSDEGKKRITQNMSGKNYAAGSGIWP
jgi:hypothetical protein